MTVYRGNVHPFLLQDDIWMSKNGPIRIKDMASDHKRQSARWLYERATPLVILVEQEINMNSARGYDGISSIMELMSVSAREWIVTTPLYRALMA